MIAPPVLPLPDARRPFAVDTRALGRRPGTMWERGWQMPAPDGLRQSIVRVPEGAVMDLQVRLETVLDGVLATATVTAPTAGECGRCLDDVAGTVTVHVQELYSYPEQALRFARTSGADYDDETRQLDGDMLDLEQPVRDAVVLALPASPLCRPDCGGLCPSCGVHLDEVGPEHGHDEHDPRWGSLRGLTDIPLGED